MMIKVGIENKFNHTNSLEKFHFIVMYVLLPLFSSFDLSFYLDYIFCSQVWAVLKPGFLALLEDPFNNKPLDIVMFDVLPSSTGKGETKIYLAEPVKERNPLRYTFKVIRFYVYGNLFKLED
jgi:hypothetical protein